MASDGVARGRKARGEAAPQLARLFAFFRSWCASGLFPARIKNQGVDSWLNRNLRGFELKGQPPPYISGEVQNSPEGTSRGLRIFLALNYITGVLNGSKQ